MSCYKGDEIKVLQYIFILFYPILALSRQERGVWKRCKKVKKSFLFLEILTLTLLVMTKQYRKECKLYRQVTLHFLKNPILGATHFLILRRSSSTVLFQNWHECNSRNYCQCSFLLLLLLCALSGFVLKQEFEKKGKEETGATLRDFFCFPPNPPI